MTTQSPSSEPKQDPDLISRLWRFHAQFRDGRDLERLLRSALKLGREYFHAPEGSLATLEPDGLGVQIDFSTPPRASWDRDLIANFLRGERVSIPPELMLARLRRRGRMWGALVLRDDSAVFHWDSRQAFSWLGDAVNELIDRIDRARIAEVRGQIDRKILEQVRPKHLFYKLLHGIRSLTEYDHSAALLFFDRDQGALEVVAEQIAWQKGKSDNVGLTIPLSDRVREALLEGAFFGFDRNGNGWHQWAGPASPELVELLDYNPLAASERFPAAENSLLCLPLVTRNGLLGALKVAAVHPGALRDYEAELLLQFLPQAAVAIQNLQRTENLEQQVIATERKAAMADLARGVAHDINNSLGAMLPLVQQLRDDVEHGEFTTEIALADLREVERALQSCRRIFSGMLQFARNAARNVSEVSLPQVIDSTVNLFRQSFARNQMTIEVDVAPDIPVLQAVHSDIEQILLNLISNARDAMQAGDHLQITAARHAGHVVLVVRDTGSGIPDAVRERIHEPFFTTKVTGTGLGLAICRSIISQLRGTFDIASSPGRGTRVTISIPLDAEGER